MAATQSLQLPIFDTTGGFLDAQVSPGRLINMYMAYLPTTKGMVLTTIPGTSISYSRAGTNTRLLYTNGTILFGVFDEHLETFDSSLTPTTVGDFTTTSGHIGVSANNNKQITFVDNVDGWVYDYSGAPTFTQITDINFPSQPVDTAQLDGYTIVAQSSSNKWFLSDIDNSTSYDALNFARLTSEQDTLVGIRVHDRRIYIFGNRVTEIFYNSLSIEGVVGISTFPFVRDDNNILQYGCGAVGSIAESGNVMAWLATQKDGGPSIRAIVNKNFKKLSDLSIDYRLAQLLDEGKTLTDAKGYLKNFNGMDFYTINFVSADQCFVYNFDTEKWHEQRMIADTTYFASVHAYFNNKHYLGNATASEIRLLSDAFLRNDTEDIHTTIITPVIEHPSMQRMELTRVILQSKQGVGNVTTYQNPDGTYNDFGIDPEITLSISTDGGETYGSSGVKSIGKVGYYDWHTFWRTDNLQRRYVFKFEKFKPFKWTVMNSVLVYELKGY